MMNGFESTPSVEQESQKELPRHFDALVVLGHIWPEHPRGRPPEEFKLKLSMESKMAAVAAAEMFKNKLTSKIIFSGGKTAGQAYPSEAAEMARYLKQKYPEIPDNVIILEEASIDTAENAELVAEILKELPELKTIALLTMSMHLPRAQALFKEFGIDPHPFPTEEQLKDVSPEYEQFVEKYSKFSKADTKAQLLEWILRGMQWFDRKGTIPRMITKKWRQ